MADYTILAVLLAILLGVAAGKAHERYKLRDGRWVDRRRLRETPHYMLGLNFLVDQQVDRAIDELTQAASTGPDALEIQMILGNLYRQKGQVGRAITVHQSLLQRPNLTTLEHAYVLLCLGLDFRTGGFVDRAAEAFQEVLRLDPKNRYALVNLQKLYEEQQRWDEALRVREQIARIDAGRHPDEQPILAFLRNEIGAARMAAGDLAGAAKEFDAAVDVEPRTAPAHLNLGDLRERQGNLAGAVAAWERLARVAPDRAWLAFDRLERAYRTLNTPARFVDLCRQVIDGHPGDWRARTALSRHYMSARQPRDAFEVLMAALPHNPHALAIHEAIWQALGALGLDPVLVGRYTALTHEAVFYLDPHVCVRCRYRSTGLVWKCPHCHEWNTFVEERLAPARTAGVEVEAAPLD